MCSHRYVNVSYFQRVMYVILLCGSGDTEQLGEYLHIVMEIGDECFQTAYLCKNFYTVRFLWDKGVHIQNCFLKEEILCDERIWEEYSRGTIHLVKH